MTDQIDQETAAEAPAEPLGEVTDPDIEVRTAEREAVEAEDLVEALEHRFVDGDETVTQEVIEKQRGLAAFAQLQVKRVQTKAARVKAARRTAAAEQIVAEIDEYEPGIRKKIVDKLRAIQRAEDALVAMAEEHDERVRDWRTRAEALGIPDYDGRPLPPAIDGRLALGRGLTAGGFGVALRAGRRNVEAVGGDRLLRDFKMVSDRLATVHDREGLIRSIEGGAEEQPEPAQDVLFFRNRVTGGRFEIAPDSPMVEHMRANPDIVEIPREEALGS